MVRRDFPKMNYRVCFEVSEIDQAAWSEFVYNHPQGNIFQTPQMFAAYREDRKYEPLLVVIFDEHNKIDALLAALIQREGRGCIGNLTARSITWGGPLVKNNDPELTAALLNEYDKIAGEKAIYSQFRNLWNFGDLKSIFRDRGYIYEDHLNILVDLTRTKEQLWKEIDSKRRNEIRRAEREGTTVREINDIAEVEECVAILRAVYREAALPFPADSFFSNIYRQLAGKEYIKFFGAFNDNKLIGTMAVFTYKKTIYNWYAGSYKQYYNKYPNDLLPWEVMLWGKQRGFTIFDFGGAGKPGKAYGVRDYKKKFGGEFYHFGRFEKIHKKILYKIGKIGYFFYKYTRR